MLAKAVRYSLSLKTWDGYVPGLYDEIRSPLLAFQTAALLEVVHSAVGKYVNMSMYTVQ